MDFPILDIPYLGGGLLIAVIAVVHVYVAHFAVGGGLFLVLTERKGLASGSQAILDYTRRHTKFFLLLTMVFGSLTGVAIWFTIAILNPPGTLVLIRTFTFAWATEWVFFVGEIVTLLVYFYTFGKMKPRLHQRVGWLYFLFGWLSLFMINGIIGFMLTPGDWLTTGDFWDAFFNPSFWPSLFFRSFLCFTIAGLFAFVTSSFQKDADLAEELTRYAAKWTVVPFAGMALSAWWYFKALPAAPQAMIAGGNNEITPYVQGFFIFGPLIFLGGLAMAMKMPREIKRLTAFGLIILGLIYMGSFEFIREAGRKPYIIHGHMWSTGITADQAQGMGDGGFLASARWVRNKEVTPDNRLEAGAELFKFQCLACHSVGGPINDIIPLTAKHSVFGLDSQLTGQGRLNQYMPPFLGTPAEREALAGYVVEVLHGKAEPKAAQARPDLPDQPVPPFDADGDEYVLLAWNNLGMHCISDSDPYWVLLPPANDIFAQLVRRGDAPEVVTEGVTISYKVEQGFENSADHVKFWKHVKSIFGAEPPENVGLSGHGMSGDMKADADHGVFEASLIPVVPYPDGGDFNPYPLFTVEARDTATGRLLATTKTVAPTSTEMGCKNCHGGPWKKNGVAGISDKTAEDVLVVHDRISGTNLVEKAKAGQPMLCQSCHPDPVLGAKGDPSLLNLPAALHGWHANYLTDRGTEACFACHPAAAAGPTGCLRGVHEDRGLDCASCHGYLEDHALGLLTAEQQAGKKGAARLMTNLEPRNAPAKGEIPPRVPWLNEPDCLNCHRDFQPPDTDTTYGEWTSGPEELFRLRKGMMDALYCEACHGSTHAIYPAVDAGYGANRDNLPPLQYQGQAGPIGADGNCAVCHGPDTEYTPEDSAHHPMGLR